MKGQMSIFDCFPEVCPKREYVRPGDYVTEHGAVIDHICRPAYIGELVVMDRCTESHEWWQVGRMEKYFYNDENECWRSVVYYGKEQRSLIDHFPGVEIFELTPRKWVNGKGWV